ncbi:MAG: HAD hydrolase-like protein [Acidimicrobiales bacterium]|nr:HAD hydrolase-like protein [Acidimicrobiales bacterium]HRW38796.1 HAD hydrolase-like protein [Aquihabitans sp.]
MLDAVLFDLDGTITDPEVGITGSFRRAMADVGHPVADDVDLRWMIGPTLAESLDRVGLPTDLHQAVIDGYRAHLRAEGLRQAELVAGMPEVIDGLRADGVRLALASAKMIDMGETTLRHVGLLDRFELVAGCLPDGAVRTKGQIVGDALAGLGGPDPGHVAMVGDRRHDIEGARQHGCLAVAVEWGFAEPGELDRAAPDRIVATPAELLTVLRALP